MDHAATMRRTYEQISRDEFMGIAATGAQVGIQLIDIMRFNGAGLTCEHWGVADM